MTLDLIAITPDKDTEQALTALLNRHEAIGIRPIRCAVRVHPQKDPGCHGTGHELAAAFAKEAEHALVVFDLAWVGAPSRERTVLQADVEERLRRLWGDRAACVVIEPELEAWVWSDSPHVTTALGWRGRRPSLRQWLEETGLWPAGPAKPPDPKAAFRRAMKHVHLPPSAAVFRQLAETVSVQRCTDPAFNDLLTILRRWFLPAA